MHNHKRDKSQKMMQLYPGGNDRKHAFLSSWTSSEDSTVEELTPLSVYQTEKMPPLHFQNLDFGTRLLWSLHCIVAFILVAAIAEHVGLLFCFQPRRLPIWIWLHQHFFCPSLLQSNKMNHTKHSKCEHWLFDHSLSSCQMLLCSSSEEPNEPGKHSPGVFGFGDEEILRVYEAEIWRVAQLTGASAGSVHLPAESVALSAAVSGPGRAPVRVAHRERQVQGLLPRGGVRRAPYCSRECVPPSRSDKVRGGLHFPETPESSRSAPVPADRYRPALVHSPRGLEPIWNHPILPIHRGPLTHMVRNCPAIVQVLPPSIWKRDVDAHQTRFSLSGLLASGI